MQDKDNQLTRVYVCTPYRPISTGRAERELEQQDNEERTLKACRLLTMCGFMPMAPQAYFTQFLSDDNLEEREDGMFLGMEWLSSCDELWTFGDRISEGMQTELDYAMKKHIKIRCMPEPDELAETLL